MAEPWTTVAWARGPRHRTTLLPQRYAGSAAMDLWDTARARATAEATATVASARLGGPCAVGVGVLCAGGLAAGAPCRPAIPVAPAHTARRPRRAVCQASGSPSNGRAPGAASTAGSLAPAPSHGGTRAGAAAARPAACPAHGRLHPG